MADDKAAFGVFPQMKPKRSGRSDEDANIAIPRGLARGAISGVLGAPGDIESLIRMLPGLNEETILPTSQDIEKRIPFKGTSPLEQAATSFGQIGGGFYAGPGSPLRAISAIPGALKHGAQEFALAAGQSGPRIFIGPNAKTFDGNRAMKAVAMEKKGADPVDIWRATGTFKGADGIWRQEISDQPAKFLTPDDRALRIAENKLAIDKIKEQIAPTPQKDLFPKALTEAKKEAREEMSLLKGENKLRGRNPRTQGLNAEYIFEHPELYAAYPELRNVRVNTEGGSGSSKGALSIIPSRGQLPGTMAMDIYDAGLRQNPTSTTLHEMQHAVQTIEGMHPGGNPAFAFSDPLAYEMLKQERLKMLQAMPYEDFVRQGGYTDMVQAGKDYTKYTKDLQKGIDPAYDRMLQERVAMDYYKRLGGEAEARAVQERMGMTPSQRQAEFPYASYDVPVDEIIVKPPREYKEGGRASKDEMKATPVKNPQALGVSKAIQKAHEFLSKPFGYQNPPGEILSELVGLPAVAKTLERVGYGEPLTTGAGGLGGTTRPRPETVEAALAVAPMAPATKGMPVGMVIKPKGGNWLTGDVESRVGKMKMADKMTPEWYADRERWLKEAEAKGDQRQLSDSTIRAIKQDIDVGKRNDAINDWIDRNLTNYIKKEMATPEDPVRKLAEQGITHKSDLDNYRRTPGRSLTERREAAGFPAEGLGESELARVWENLADYSFMSRPAKDVSAERYPWVSKLDPETPVYGGIKQDTNQQLGFDHIVDVLRQDVREGRIRPEQLSKVSMEQAVRRTYEYDQEMAKKMREAQIKATEGMPVYKEYPEGFKWVELKAQEPESLPEGVKRVQQSVTQGGLDVPGVGFVPAKWNPEKGLDWEQAERDARKALSYEPTEKALKYEGETMGHCVGGYCPDVMEGRSRIYSLRDAKGEPHVTIEVEPQSRIGFREGEGPKTAEERFDLQTEWLKGVESGKIGNDVTFAEWWRSQHGIPEPERPLQISQIKGKQNRAPKQEYLPYVQDFVKGGQWSDVGDLGNTGLIRRGNVFTPTEKQGLIDLGQDVPEYLTQEDIARLRRARGDLPPEEGMKRGGVVISDNPDTMMLELQDKKMQVGGFVKGGKEGAKKILSFFSKADEAAKELPRTKGTGAEFMKELEKAKGVKPAEIQHRKLDEIKAMPKMTKEEFLGELEKRPPANLTEKVLKQPSEAEIEKMAEKLADTEAKQYAKRHAESWKEEDYLFREEKERLLESDIDRLREDARFELTSGIENKGGAPKYEEYTIPGGKDYREILIKYEPYGEGTPLGNAVRALGYKGDLNDLSPRMLEDMGAPKELVSQWKAAIETFGSSHYKEPNVIAHARVSDRVTPEGERVLHVEEIQSDWHQAGRKKGYRNDQKKTDWDDPAYVDARKRSMELLNEYNSNNHRPDIQAQIEPLLREAQKAEREIVERNNKIGQLVPDAPFKKNWQELMMNRILADAAENGYDRVVITPGAIQAERYDLSKHIDGIEYSKNSNGTVDFAATKNNSTVFDKTMQTPEQVESMVGKEIAGKIFNSPDNFGSLTGIDLKVGGEGMKGFYDKMLPDYLNSLGKKYGVEVETMSMPRPPKDSSLTFGYEGGDLYNQGLINWDEFLQRSPHAAKEFSTDVHSFKITPEMRREFTEKGFPMYSVAAPVGLGATQMPVMEPVPVQITDNPDAMMLEVEDQKFGKGGAAKGIIEGIAQRLTRAPAKSKQEIEAIAERIAPQVTGEFVRGEKGTQSVAGKTQKQFAREKDLPVEFTDVKPVPKVQVVDPETLKGMVVTGVPGDPTVTGKSLVRVGDIKLDSPSPQHGGPLYGLGRPDDIFWASGIEPAGRVQSVAKEAMQAYDAPVVGQYIMMGPESINYAMHFADANLSAIDPSKMTKKQIEEFNKLIRFGDEKSGPRPSFPGIENKEDAYLHFAFDPHLRKYFNKLMQMPTVTETFGLPSGQDIRFAITEAPLRDLETGVTGYSMGRLAPDVPKSALPLSEHPTYSHDIPGQFIGGLKYPTPYELSFPDTLKAVRENPKQSGQEFGSLKMVGPRQIYDQQMIDELKMYEDYMKRLTGKKEGGEVEMGGGGATSKAAMEAFAKLKAMRGEFAGKAAEQARYAKETAHIPAKELPSFEEWKATQINVTPENVDLLRKEMGKAGGGLLKKAVKAIKGTQEVLPVAESQSNLQKFLDESKAPMRLYHGTMTTEGGKGQEAIRRIKPSKEGALGSGVYLTPQSEHASTYAGFPAKSQLERDIQTGSDFAKKSASELLDRMNRGAIESHEIGGYMLPVYAQIKNPLVLEGKGDPMIEALIKLGMDEDKATRMVERAYENKGYIGKEVETRARAAGYDGLMQYRNGDLSEVVVYDPNAIKSAIGNKGTYDTSKPDLNEASGGLIKVKNKRKAKA